MYIGNYSEYLKEMVTASKTICIIEDKDSLYTLYDEGDCLLYRGTSEDVNELKYSK